MWFKGKWGVLQLYKTTSIIHMFIIIVISLSHEIRYLNHNIHTYIYVSSIFSGRGTQLVSVSHVFTYVYEFGLHQWPTLKKKFF